MTQILMLLLSAISLLAITQIEAQVTIGSTIKPTEGALLQLRDNRIYIATDKQKKRINAVQSKINQIKSEYR